MSWQARVLNAQLRWLEKPYLARVSDPHDIRAGFERRARFWFRLPWGANARLTPLRARGLSVPALWLGREADRVVLYFHGGGYVFGSPRTHAAMLARLNRHGRLRAVLPDYRLAPEAPFPAAVEDARASFAALVAGGIAAGRIVIGGDSAGGGLALALLADLLAEGGPLPAGVFALSPLTDLTFSGASFTENTAAEVLLPAGRAAEMAALYLQGADPAQPLASPLNADFGGAPPVLMMAGDTEILRDDTSRMAARMRAQGVAVSEEIARDLPHVWPIFWRYLPEGDAALRRVADWITRLPSR